MGRETMGEKQGLTKNVEILVYRGRGIWQEERCLKGIQFRVSDLSLSAMYFQDIMAGIPRVYYCYRMFPMICVEEL